MLALDMFRESIGSGRYKWIQDNPGHENLGLFGVKPKISSA